MNYFSVNRICWLCLHSWALLPTKETTSSLAFLAVGIEENLLLKNCTNPILCFPLLSLSLSYSDFFLCCCLGCCQSSFTLIVITHNPQHISSPSLRSCVLIITNVCKKKKKKNGAKIKSNLQHRDWLLRIICTHIFK